MKLFATDALLPAGWARNVAIDIDESGMIAAVSAQVDAAGAERARGPMLPGMPNVHSHTFQRAIAGRTGRANVDGDSFWTWRNTMYAFLDRVDADAFGAIAAQAYVEMLESGYTSVAEFHYVHHDPAGRPYANPAELALRVIDAAEHAGIGLTLLPVFYAHGAFGGAPPVRGQRRFVTDPASFARLHGLAAAAARERGMRVGVAPHSLRAVTPYEFAAVVPLSREGEPIHIHVAEQAKEVADCIAWCGRRPIEWLLDNAVVNGRWCLVHATHATSGEIVALARSGAVAGLAPTTESDLGDGTFAADAYRAAHGTFGIGTDSNTAIDPFVELRTLEYSQRLRDRRRNVLVVDDRPVGRTLYDAALEGGARALAQPVGAIAADRRADLIVLDAGDAAMVDQPVEDVLDAAIFGPCRRRVRDVMVAGRWRVRDGRHVERDATLAGYRRALAPLIR
jgi:formimidoylglutamate deiminase